MKPQKKTQHKEYTLYENENGTIGLRGDRTRIFAREAGIPEDKIETTVITQDEFDAIVTEHQHEFLKEGSLLSEISRLAKNVKWDMTFIKANAVYAYRYLHDIVQQTGKRFPEFEETLKQSLVYTYAYLDCIVNQTGKRFPEFEETLKQSTKYTYWYLLNIVKQTGKRFPEFEETLKKDTHNYSLYEKNIVNA